MQTKLFVQNLTPYCSEEDLQRLFASFGNVKSATIPKDRDSGRSRGFGFVDMMSQTEAKAALESLNKTKYKGKKLRVAFSERPTERKRSTAYSYLY